MRLIIQENAKLAGEWTARYIASKINEKTREGKTFVLGLPTGSSPLETYGSLVRLCQEGAVSFANVVTFNMDEYVGLDENHPQSYHRFMWDNLFEHIDIKPENVHILNGMAEDLARECRRYEETIAAAGGIDLFLGGVGSDGHLAFNEPFSSLSSRTRIKTLTMETILDNARFFDDNTDRVPRTALTVGVGTVLDAREVVVLATGNGKARALRHIVEESISHAWTASALQNHPAAVVVCDHPAAYELRVGTYEYFKQIEGESLDPHSIRL